MYATSIAEFLIEGWLSEDDYDDITQVQGTALSAFDRSVYTSLVEMHHDRSASHDDNDGKDGNDEEPSSLKTLVLHLAVPYSQSMFHMSDCAPHIRLDSLLSRIHNGKETRRQEIRSALTQLQFRLSGMATADHYLDIMGVPCPNGLRCREWDHAKNYKYCDEFPNERAVSVLLRDRASALFPRPLINEIQGMPFSQPAIYVGLAFCIAGLEMDVIREKVDGLVGIIEPVLRAQARIIKEVTDVKTKRLELWQAFGKVGNMSPVKSRSRSRSASPRKRRSRGQSLGEKEDVGLSSSRGRGGYVDR